jgi:hypothetical protein
MEVIPHEDVNKRFADLHMEYEKLDRSIELLYVETSMYDDK